jgi:hypothetical protein
LVYLTLCAADFFASIIFDHRPNLRAGSYRKEASASAFTEVIDNPRCAAEDDDSQKYCHKLLHLI